MGKRKKHKKILLIKYEVVIIRHREEFSVKICTNNAYHYDMGTFCWRVQLIIAKRKCQRPLL